MATKISPKLLNLIKENRNFLIVSHINPEGDAIGSCVALSLGLQKIGKSVYILNRDPVPEIVKFLPHSGRVSQKVPSQKFDVVFIIDCVNMERTGFNNLRAEHVVIIDHHIPQSGNVESTASTPASINFIDPEASAAGELVYKLLYSLKIPIDRDIAVNLYTAIFTDTGGFRYSNTHPETLNIAARLIESGADPWQVTIEIYESSSYNRLKLLAQSLATLEKKDRIAWITITREMFKKTQTSAEDTENFVDYPRTIYGIEVSVLFREDKKNSYKISFRSKGNVNVEKIAKTFGGGGHANAAGCKVYGTLPEVKKKILNVVKKAMISQMKN
jgi:phosphoesterase RecJ-like protein